MKKILILIVLALLLSSCAIFRPGFRFVTDYSERMEILQRNFPEIYNLYRNGDVVLVEMYEYTDKNGHPQVHIEYHYR